MKHGGLLFMLTACLAAQSATPASWYWTSSLIGGGCTVCAYDADGALPMNISYGSPLSVLRMAKHQDGTVRCLNIAGPAAELAELVPDQSGVGSVIPIPFAHDLCVDGSGHVWVATGGLFWPLVIEQRDSTGAAIISSWTLPAGSLASTSMTAAPNGHVWVLAQDGLYELDPAGSAPTSPVSTTPTGAVVAAEVDHQGNVWTLVDRTGGGRWLVRHDGGMTQLAAVNLDNAVAFCLDGDGNPRVLVDDVVKQTVWYYDRALNPIRSNTAAPQPGMFQSLIVDWEGNTWFTAPGVGGEVLVQRVDGSTRATIPGNPATAQHGDRTGLHLMAVLDRNGDADGDLVSNATEVSLGSDLLDPLDPPLVQATNPTPVPGEQIVIFAATNDTPGFTCIIAAAEGLQGFPVVDPGMSVPLSFDWLLAYWLSPQNTLATNVYGTLDGTGSSFSNVVVPNLPFLVGQSFHFCAVTLDLSGAPSQISTPLTVTVQ